MRNTMRVFSELSELCEKDGHYDRALGWARELLSMGPIREEAHRAVMRILTAAGR